jgi:hypothetical protein
MLFGSITPDLSCIDQTELIWYFIFAKIYLKNPYRGNWIENLAQRTIHRFNAGALTSTDSTGAAALKKNDTTLPKRALPSNQIDTSLAKDSTTASCQRPNEARQENSTVHNKLKRHKNAQRHRQRSR